MSLLSLNGMIFVAIVGSRDCKDYNRFDNIVSRLLKNYEMNEIVIVTGCDDGAGKMARTWADTNECTVIVYTVDWSMYGPNAVTVKNNKIINAADFCIAFPSRKGGETQETIKKCKIKGIDVREYYID
ncbi:MAG: DUF2493 domain-containing protein [Bacteroidetes bacterium]|nr:DUF2493 domain-containing protein [Bacteroidota bacterium]